MGVRNSISWVRCHAAFLHHFQDSERKFLVDTNAIAQAEKAVECLGCQRVRPVRFYHPLQRNYPQLRPPDGPELFQNLHNCPCI
eukprot:9468324-Pyramimonas_sp.AAC.1